MSKAKFLVPWRKQEGEEYESLLEHFYLGTGMAGMIEPEEPQTIVVPAKDNSYLNMYGEKVSSRIPGYTIYWRYPEPFVETMIFSGFSRGRSAAHATYVDSLNRRFVVFLTDLAKLIDVEDNVKSIDGRWIPCKHGTNYGIRKYYENER